HLEFIRSFSGRGYASILIGLVAGLGITLLMHSSSASITLTITLAMGGALGFDFAAAMILGANIGTTIDAIMAAIGSKAAAKQTALVHVLFNVVGSLIALLCFKPLLLLVEVLTPGSVEGSGIAAHLAMFHTVFNLLGTLLFLPFVKQFAWLVTRIIKDEAEPEKEPLVYRLEHPPGTIQNTPELNIIRVEKEIRDMAGLASRMFSAVSSAFINLPMAENREAAVEALVKETGEREDYADQMRVELTGFLIECTRPQLNYRTEKKVYQLLRIISDLEDMTDNCYSIGLLLERSVKKDLLFKHKEMEALSPYVRQVEEFLSFVREHLGRTITDEQASYAEELEKGVNKFRNRLRKMGRKRIEAGKDVKRELLFIDLVRRIEKVGDYCYSIAVSLRRY
ncbi:MAG: Na/Pi symporter, partial [Treponema sp.]|nr:Na/Pi symporter [Treponema sp.]